jgi:hypothetical protein
MEKERINKREELNEEMEGARFSYTARSYTDVPTRFSYTARSYTDVSTRFSYTAHSYTDVSTFQLHGT